MLLHYHTQVRSFIVIEVGGGCHFVEPPSGKAHAQRAGELEQVVVKEKVLEPKANVPEALEGLVSMVFIIVVNPDRELLERDGEESLGVVAQSIPGDQVGSEHVELRISVLGGFRASLLEFREGNVLITVDELGQRVKLEVQVEPELSRPQRGVVLRSATCAALSAGESRICSACSLGVRLLGETQKSDDREGDQNWL